jgi:hypothetical protein
MVLSASPEPPPCFTTFGAGTAAVHVENVGADFLRHLGGHAHAFRLSAKDLHRKRPLVFVKRICRFDFGLLRVKPSTEMNSETDRPTPPRRFNKRRKETSVTPAIGESISGGLISMSRILNGLISVIRV